MATDDEDDDVDDAVDDDDADDGDDGDDDDDDADDDDGADNDALHPGIDKPNCLKKKIWRPTHPHEAPPRK